MTKRGEQPIDHDEEVQKSMERNLVQQAEQIAPVVEKFLERIRDREVPKEYKKFEDGLSKESAKVVAERIKISEAKNAKILKSKKYKNAYHSH